MHLKKRTSSSCCHGVAEATGSLRAVGALGAAGAAETAGAVGAAGTEKQQEHKEQ